MKYVCAIAIQVPGAILFVTSYNINVRVTVVVANQNLVVIVTRHTIFVQQDSKLIENIDRYIGCKKVKFL